MLPHLLGFWSWTGVDNVSGVPYGFWSGLGSVIVPWAPTTWVLYRRHQCHTPWCLRIGKFLVKEGENTWQLCHKHHPIDDPGKCAATVGERQ